MGRATSRNPRKRDAILRQTTYYALCACFIALGWNCFSLAGTSLKYQSGELLPEPHMLIPESTLLLNRLGFVVIQKLIHSEKNNPGDYQLQLAISYS